QIVVNKYHDVEGIRLMLSRDEKSNITLADGGRQTNTITNMYNYDTSKPEIDHFILTHYGLSEPHWLDRRPATAVPWHLYFTLGGIVLLVAATLMFVKLKRANDRV